MTARVPSTLPRVLFAAAPTSLKLPMTLDFEAAAQRLASIATRTPLQLSRSLSRRYGAEVWLKREDLQVVRSYKLRGASNLIGGLTEKERKQGVVCASAGNHAQGVAYACRELGIHAVIYMPKTTPRQKVAQTQMWGERFAETRLVGDTFDDAQAEARSFCEAEGRTFVPPFDDWRIIEGQGTVALEVLADCPQGGPDFVFMPVGGGGLSAGMGLAFRGLGGPQAPPAPRSSAQLVGLEPAGAPSMLAALHTGAPVRLDTIETFVDGASVKRVGDRPFAAVRATLDVMHAVPEGRVCTAVLELYNREGLVVEPAGALAVAALDDFAGAIVGKRVVAVISGGNADVDRLAEIKERSLRFEGLKHYFLVRFPQRAGALKEFVTSVLPPSANIVRFEYLQRTNTESGPALVGLEIARREDIAELRQNFQRNRVDAEEIKDNSLLLRFLL